MSAEPVIAALDLVKYFPVRRGVLIPRKVGDIRAVDHVSLALEHGETLGVVGESGAGKSTLGRLILRLMAPDAGEIRFAGRSLAHMDAAALFDFRRHVQMVFQDPFGSLNPRLTVGASIEAPLRNFRMGTALQRRRRVMELLELVGLDPRHVNRYPHEFSGGQAQRIGIARAIATSPRVIVLDEPVSALDVSIQAQILNLLSDLKERLQHSYVFIANNLNVVEHISDRVAVMHRGRIVEVAPREVLYARPAHPYTQALLASVLTLDASRSRLKVAEEPQAGDGEERAEAAAGCRYRFQCPLAMDVCARTAPPLEPRESEGHRVACHAR